MQARSYHQLNKSTSPYRSRQPLVLLLFWICSLLLAGCWPLAETPAPAPSQLAGRTVRLGGWLPPRTLDPARADDPTALMLVHAIYSGLLTYDAVGRPLPDLASGWTLSDDGRTYTFSLREGLTFHNGRRITAADFKYSFERACSPQLAAPAPVESLACARLLGDVRGMGDLLAGSSNQAEGIRVVSESQLEISLNNVDVTFPGKLAAPTNALLDRSAVEGNPTWPLQPVGSGPFVVLRSDEGGIELARYPAYAGQPAAADYVSLRWQSDTVTTWNTSAVDLITFPFTGTLDIANARPDQQRLLPRLQLRYLGLNTRLKPFDDPNVRRAFALALDQAQVAVAGEAAYSLLPPAQAQAVSRFDRSMARRLLEESSYKGGANLPPITIYSYSSFYAPPIAAQLSAVLGISIASQQVEYSDYLRDRPSYPAFADHYDLAYPDGLSAFNALLASSSPDNPTAYANLDLDRQLTSLDEEPDFDKRAAALRQLEAATPDLPIIPIAWSAQNLLVADRVEVATTPYGLDLRGVKIKLAP